MIQRKYLSVLFESFMKKDNLCYMINRKCDRVWYDNDMIIWWYDNDMIIYCFEDLHENKPSGGHSKTNIDR